MRARIKILLCVLLAVFAMVSLWSVLGNLGLLPTEKAAAVSAGQAYLIGTWDGYVAVFCPPEASSPTTITEIRVRDLPLTDRLALSSGIGAEDYRAVVALLEDFGS